MKVSANHKAKGDDVEWCNPFYHYDIVYQSKVFSNTYSDDISFIPQADKIIKGGTGYAIEVVNGKEIYHKELDKPLPYESAIILVYSEQQNFKILCREKTVKPVGNYIKIF